MSTPPGEPIIPPAPTDPAPGPPPGAEKQAAPAAATRLWSLVEDFYLASDGEALLRSLASHVEYSQAKTRHTATSFDWYTSLALTVRDRLMERWNDTQQAYYEANAKRVYYLSLEFLMGRTLGNALLALGMTEEISRVLNDLGQRLEDLQEIEPDAGLGNGGLGRLAACFLDSMATLQYPGYGYGIRYDYGIFEQVIRDGQQVERPDRWLRYGNPWEIVRPEYTVTVRLGGRVEGQSDAHGEVRRVWIEERAVQAIPYDTPIPGHGNDTVNTLRLWSAAAVEDFDLGPFNRGDYVAAVSEQILSETISRVLYPTDHFQSGKELRLEQEYFFVSATLQDILRRYRVGNSGLDAFPDKVAIQLNDTNPAIAIAELMRLFVDGERLPWETAWNLCVRTFGYTNHTVLPEALETWSVELLGALLPRHLEIIYEVNRRFLESVAVRYPGDPARLARLSIVQEQPVKAVRMAHLAIAGSHSVNGVAALHSRILRESLFADFFALYPERFNNKTNGVTPRRWLKSSNPRLADLIDSTIGCGWITDLGLLDQLAGTRFVGDPAFRAAWRRVKRENKRELADLVRRQQGLALDLDSIFDCQVKRLHEYKRQLLNVLHILALYHRIKDSPAADFVPRTFLFAAKAAPGYATAKLIIRLIHSLAGLINGDADVAGRLRVVFLPNYGVSLAERIFPGADVSEQISTAGLEASGTGNMKFALNGALTIGTLDGANVEILEEVGAENIFIFGLTAEQVRERRAAGYRPRDHYEADPELRRVLDHLAAGLLPGEDGLFAPLVRSLLDGGDGYFVLADFAAYAACQHRVAQAFLDDAGWTARSIRNTAHSGKFSSDRTIRQYAEEIWGVRPVRPRPSPARQLIGFGR
jgi:glycogen phosphorylase